MTLIQKHFALFILAVSFCGCGSSLYMGPTPTGSKSLTAHDVHRTTGLPVGLLTRSTEKSNDSSYVEIDNFTNQSVGGVIRYGEAVVSTRDIFEAARKNNAQDIRIFVQRGVSANVIKRGWPALRRTPLFYAAQKNSVEAAEALLELGAELNARDKNDNTALHVAARHNSSEVAEVLLSEGIEVDARNEYEQTALMIAAQRDRLEVARVIVKWGADLTLTDEDGETAWDMARLLWPTKIGRLLRIDKQDNKNMELQ